MQKIARLLQVDEFHLFDTQGNIVSLDNCITRLRLAIKDYTLVDEKKIKSAGVAGVMRPSKTSVQVIVGTKVPVSYTHLDVYKRQILTWLIYMSPQAQCR